MSSSSSYSSDTSFESEEERDWQKHHVSNNGERVCGNSARACGSSARGSRTCENKEAISDTAYDKIRKEQPGEIDDAIVGGAPHSSVNVDPSLILSAAGNSDFSVMKQEYLDPSPQNVFNYKCHRNHGKRHGLHSTQQFEENANFGCNVLDQVYFGDAAPGHCRMGLDDNKDHCQRRRQRHHHHHHHHHYHHHPHRNFFPRDGHPFLQTDEPKLFTCSVCDVTVTSKWSLRHHMKTHNGSERNHCCEKCPKAFQHRYQLQRHTFRIHGACRICEVPFEGKMQRHLHLYEHEEVEYKCEPCKMGFLNVHFYQRHLHKDMRRQERFQSVGLDECLFNKRKHRRCNRDVKVDVDNSVICKQCGRMLKNERILARHMRRHEELGTHICHICTFSFTSAYELKAHVKTHKEEKTFSCHICSEKFKTEKILRQHELMHLGEKKYICEECGSSFLQKANLSTHLRIHSGEKPFTCPQENCPISFTTSSSLKRHVRSLHSGLHPFKCQHCAESFSSLKFLRRHNQTHKSKPHTSTSQAISEVPNTSLTLPSDFSSLAFEDSTNETQMDIK